MKNDWGYWFCEIIQCRKESSRASNQTLTYVPWPVVVEELLDGTKYAAVGDSKDTTAPELVVLLAGTDQFETTKLSKSRNSPLVPSFTIVNLCWSSERPLA